MVFRPCTACTEEFFSHNIKLPVSTFKYSKVYRQREMKDRDGSKILEIKEKLTNNTTCTMEKTHSYF